MQFQRTKGLDMILEVPLMREVRVALGRRVDEVARSPKTELEKRQVTLGRNTKNFMENSVEGKVIVEMETMLEKDIGNMPASEAENEVVNGLQKMIVPYNHIVLNKDTENGLNRKQMEAIDWRVNKDIEEEQWRQVADGLKSDSQETLRAPAENKFDNVFPSLTGQIHECDQVHEQSSLSGHNHNFQYRTQKPEDKAHICELCGAGYRHAASLRKHKLHQHHYLRKFKCELCNREFSSEVLLVKHSGFHKVNVCDWCGKGFKYPSSLHRHQRVHVMKSFACDECDKTFVSDYVLRRHAKTHHVVRMNFSCDRCCRAFKTLQAMADHVRSHSTAAKIHRCSVCGKAFQARSDLTKHERTHTNEKPYACELCDKRFKQHGHLFSHRITHTGDKHFQCDHCGLKVSTRRALRIHEVVHGLHQNELSECAMCQRKFATPARLKRHLLVHSLPKVHGCDVCGKTFTMKVNLQNHICTRIERSTEVEMQWIPIAPEVKLEPTS